jgi:hemolysin III
MLALPTPAFVLLLAGGFFYTAGVAFHLCDRLPYSTAVWHGFVLVAAACHYLAVLIALAPAM